MSLVWGALGLMDTIFSEQTELFKIDLTVLNHTVDGKGLIVGIDKRYLKAHLIILMIHFGLQRVLPSLQLLTYHLLFIVLFALHFRWHEARLLQELSE